MDIGPAMRTWVPHLQQNLGMADPKTAILVLAPPTNDPGWQRSLGSESAPNSCFSGQILIRFSYREDYSKSKNLLFSRPGSALSGSLAPMIGAPDSRSSPTASNETLKGNS